MKTTYIFLLCIIATASGCAGVASDAVSVNRVPNWLLAQPRANNQPINMLSLRADPPETYLLGPRDVLGVYVPGMLGERDQMPPTHFSEKGDQPPAFGFPIPIRDDGTLVLPLIAPLKVAGLTLTQAEDEVRRRYVDGGLLLEENLKILVTLIRKRTKQVLVVREDTGAASPTAGVVLVGPSKRGNVFTVDLPADEADVMHALAQTGGLPGLDAKNEVVILRGKFADAVQRDGYLQDLCRITEYAGATSLVTTADRNVIRLPLRVEPGMPQITWREEDIMLDTGDVLFIESRDREVFYTGGVLPGREIPLPRDYDLDVLAAISLAGGSVATGVSHGGNAGVGGGRGGAGGAALPPTQIVVLRRVADGSQVAIRICLRKAMKDPRQRILIKEGDYVLLEYTPAEFAANAVLGVFSVNYFLNGIN